MLSSESSEYHIDVLADAVNPVELLASESGLSKQKVKQAMQKGAVWLTDNKGTHRLRRQSKKIHSGTTLHFYFDPDVLNERTDDALLVSDENEYSVWYKPRGMLSQGSKWGDHCAINRWVEQHLEPQRPAFVVHRLDRFASGLILIAHKKKMANLLADLFREKKIKKQYKVIVHGKFSGTTVTYRNEIDNKPAVSHVSLLQYDDINNQSLLQVEIETGRKHQIRLHLSEAGFPVVGDRLFGDDNNDIDLQLTAFKLLFTSPIEGKDKIYTLSEALQPKLKNLPE
ncbi:MAG: RNA pseudouridine synthase [Gammaproteobacteria bacterium]|nr:RNA pseudouridine synthase [Gammaproteobacteria bacterium]